MPRIAALSLSVNFAVAPLNTAKSSKAAGGIDDDRGFAAALDLLRETRAADDAAAARRKSAASKEAGATGQSGLEIEAKKDDDDVFDDLSDALGALENATASGEPVDPEVLAKLEAALEAIAAALGISLDGDTSADATDALGALAGAVAGELPPVSAASGAAVAADTDATAAIDTRSALEKLADRIGKLAGQMEATQSGIAAKLEALAGKLSTTELSADMLTKLGLDTEATDADLEKALAGLLGTKAEPTPTKPPAPFGDPGALADADAEAKGVSKTPVLADNGDPLGDTKAQADVRTGAEAKADVKPMVAAALAAATPSLVKADSTTELNLQAAVGAVRTDFAVSAKAVHAAYQTPQAQINLPQFAFEIVRNFQAGQNRFQIRLDPAELGRVDVNLDIDRNGAVNARLTVERAETLDLLQRDQRALEKALALAGLDAGKTNLEFSLRQNPFTAQGDADQGSGSDPVFSGPAAAELDTQLTQTIYRGSATAGGVNIFA